MDKRSKAVLIGGAIIIALVALAICGGTQTANATTPDRVHIPQSFSVHATPGSPSLGRYSPQYVTVLETRDDGWKRIETWRGDMWINLEISPYAYRLDLWDDSTVDLISRMVWREMRGLHPEHARPIVRVVLNRFERGFASTIEGVVTAPGQFAWQGGRVHQPYRDVVLDELIRWSNGEPACMILYPLIQCEHALFFGGGHRRVCPLEGVTRIVNIFRSHHRGMHCNYC